MLGRKTYEPEELAQARKAVDDEVKAYKKVAKAAAGDAAAVSALAAFEPLLVNGLIMMLDRFFIHRVRPVVGKDPNPLNEVEVLTESLLSGTTLKTNKVIKWAPDQMVLGLEDGDPIDLTVAQFEKLAKAFFAELEARFIEA